LEIATIDLLCSPVPCCMVGSDLKGHHQPQTPSRLRPTAILYLA
jgi:hypothetical protein